MENLNKQIDLEELETAKRLNEESNMNREEMNNYMQDDDDDELDDEQKQMEAEILGQALPNVDNSSNKQSSQQQKSQNTNQRKAQLA